MSLIIFMLKELIVFKPWEVNEYFIKARVY